MARRCGLVSPGRLTVLVGLALLVTTTGCGGCRQDPVKAQKELEKKLAEERNKPKPKPDFEVNPLATQPAAAQPAKADEPAQADQPLGPPMKPGHWTGAMLSAKTNNFDFLGDLEIVVTDRRDRAVPLAGVPFDLATSREIALPKRQPKVFETLLYVPPASGPAMVSCRLNTRQGGRRAWEIGHRLAPMPSYQYHFVVLARRPDRYAYLRGLPSVKPPSEGLGERTDAYYRVTLLPGDRPPSLPGHPLLWTSIACVLWDDAEPASLTLDQQQALLDWLHWGGQLILSGPDTLDTLRDSFLAAYLPAAAAGVREFAQADFQVLCAWSKKTGRPLVPTGKWSGVQLQPHRGARFLPGSGDLLAERRVGRGRIVVSAFRLSGRELTSWPGLDEMFNAFLLRRPARRFADHVENGLQVLWAGGQPRLDAALTTNVRFFTRDTGMAIGSYGPDAQAVSALDVDLDPPVGTGVAAWNDSGPVPRAACAALQKAAQIEIPDRGFVFWVLVAYLAVLVPANWCVFRVLGRVEWAWAAAPVIAVACTAVVIRMAQLDIGFARSRTEIAVVELQGSHPRAHVTRYTALYTALTTLYDFRFDDPGSLAQPLAKLLGATPSAENRRLLYRHGQEATLSDLFVESNSTGMAHCEQMLDIGGGLALVDGGDDGLRVVNRTTLSFHEAGILRKDDRGAVETAWLGTLEPGAAATVVFVRPGTPRGPWWSDKRKHPALTSGGLSPGELDLTELAQKAEDPATCEPGETRLVAVVDQELGGLEITPTAPQSQRLALVVAHLNTPGVTSPIRTPIDSKTC